MKINKTYTIATLLIAACLTSLGIQAAPRSTPVTVVNDKSNPVPVTGAVEVTRGTISIDNDAANPVPVVISDPVQVNVGTNYRFIGSTTTTVPADVGVNGMNNGCRVEFGTQARVCTSKEFFQTPDLTGFPADVESRWVIPTVTHVIEEPALGFVHHITYSGRALSTTKSVRTVSCSGYISASPFSSMGTVVRRTNFSTAIKMFLEPCDQSHNPVVCCTPQ